MADEARAHAGGKRMDACTIFVSIAACSLNSRCSYIFLCKGTATKANPFKKSVIAPQKEWFIEEPSHRLFDPALTIVPVFIFPMAHTFLLLLF
jgi:hypothetical protein